MAMAQVLGTYELLEQILLHLPLRQLLLAQRISKHIRDLIRSSDSIHNALFLRPAAPAVHPYVLPCEDWQVPMTVWRLPGSEDSVRPIVNPFLTKNSCPHRNSKQLNPSLRFWGTVCPGQGSPVLVHRTGRERERYVAHSCEPADTLPGSWEGMFVTQPPVETSLETWDAIRVGEITTVKHVYEACILSIEERGEAHNDHCRLHGSEQWDHLALDIDVDIITGSKMLTVFRMSYDELFRGGFLWKYKKDLWQDWKIEQMKKVKTLFFSTVEILESILLQLPLRQIISMLRTSKAFGDAYWRSDEIKTAVPLSPLHDLYDAHEAHPGEPDPTWSCDWWGCYVQHSRAADHFGRAIDVDIVTGSEMLEIVDARVEELRGQGLLWYEENSEDPDGSSKWHCTLP